MTPMHNYETVASILAPLMAGIVILGGSAFGACEGPAYRVGRIWEDGAAKVVLDVSISIEDFAPSRLICLATALKRDYPRRNVQAFIFSSFEAAMGFIPIDFELPREVRAYGFKLHGRYVYDKEQRIEYLTINPDGHSVSGDSDSLLETRIALPITVTPTCKLAMRDRCLLEFDHIYYPPVDTWGDVSGRVTLTGIVEENGIMTGVSVISAKSDPHKEQRRLADFALKNLSTWRFESAKRKDQVHITYVFKRAGREVSGVVRYRLPDEVLIQYYMPAMQ